MQEAVTLFLHSISHSNNGDQLISIEFLPLFNRFTVLFELSKHSSKASFQIPALLLFSLPYDQSSLDYSGVFGGKENKYGQLDELNAKEKMILQHTFILSIYLNIKEFLEREIYLELNSTCN